MAELPVPGMGPEETDRALSQTVDRLERVTSQLDQAQGELRAMGDPAALSARLLLSETLFMPEILAFSIVIYLLASAAASPSQHAPIIPPALDRREEISYCGLPSSISPCTFAFVILTLLL